MSKSFKNTKISVWRMVFVMAAGLLLVVSNGFAGDAAIKVKEIKQPPALNTPGIQEEIPIVHYFVKGTVDAVGDNWITINDHQLFIAPDASLNCGVGDFVGIQVNDERKVISCERVRK